eukprot:jgi/Ulvmu1/8350/UM042_0056.1
MMLWTAVSSMGKAQLVGGRACIASHQSCSITQQHHAHHISTFTGIHSVGCMFMCRFGSMLVKATAILGLLATATATAGSEGNEIQAGQQVVHLPAQIGRILLESAALLDPEPDSVVETDSGGPKLVEEDDSGDEDSEPGSKAQKKAQSQAAKAERKATKAQMKATKKAAQMKKKTEKQAAKTERKEKKKAAKAEKKEAKKFKWADKGKNGFKWKYGKPKRVWRKGEIVYEQDGVICKALSTELLQRSESVSAELHASAVAEVFEYLCNPGPDFNATYIMEVFAKAEAYAFAQAAVSAALDCKSTDKEAPNTCVSYTASATAIAEATASGHAEAVAAAVAQCPCMTDAVAASFASDELFVELVADATVTAEATVCVAGKSRSSSVVWEECTSELYAKLFAKAVAKAVTYGTCLSPEATVDVETFVDAEVTVDNTPQCDVEPTVIFTGAEMVEES